LASPPPSALSTAHSALSVRQWLVLVCLFVLSLPAVTPRIYSSDEIQYFAYLRSIWFDHDLSFENEYQYFYDRGISKSDGFHETFLERSTETGRRINFGTIGCAILWSPFYLIGDVAARVSGAPLDGFAKPYVAAVAYGSATYGFLAIALAVLCAGRLGLNAFGAALAVWLGTPLLFYMYVAPPFSHACSAFGVALFTFTWLRVRDDCSTRGLVALGAAGALMAMIREQDAFCVAGPAVDFVWSAVSAKWPNAKWQMSNAKRRLGAALAGCAAFLVVFSPQAATYMILNGHLGPHASVGHKMNWMAPHALQVLFSPGHGLFVWTPLALVALAGLVWLSLPPKGGSHKIEEEAATRSSVASAFRRKEVVGGCLLIMVALQIYVGGSVESWTVAGAFGQRRFIALTTAMVIGYAWADSALRASPHARRVFTAATVLAVYWNLALIAEFSVGLMDRQRLEPRKNAFDAFVTLPRQAPSLVYRYMFDRGSFYRESRTDDRGPRIEGRGPGTSGT
jgi:hypothetical protein